MQNRAIWSAALRTAAPAFVIVSLATCAWAQSGDSFDSWVGEELLHWQGVIRDWRLQGKLCLGITILLGALGITVSSLQAVRGRWVKATVVGIGLVVSLLTLVKAEVFEGDHRDYYRAASAGELRLHKMRRWTHPIHDQEELQEASEQVRQLLRELEEIYSSLHQKAGDSPSEVAFLGFPAAAWAQSLPSKEKPDWLGGRPPDKEQLYFVGVGWGGKLAAAKSESYQNAIAAARDDLYARLPKPEQGYDPEALASHLTEAATVLDSYYDRDPDGKGYQYFTLLGLSRRFLETDTKIFALREKVKVPAGAAGAAQNTRPTAVGYQVKRERINAVLQQDAQSRVAGETFRLFQDGRKARRSGDNRAAVHWLSAAVEQAPDFYLAWFNLALAQDAAGEHHEAQASFERAIALEPGLPVRDPSVYNTYGWFLYRQGSIAAARVHFEKALALDPSHQAARRNLDLTLKQLPSP